MQFNDDLPALPLEDFQNHYFLVFDLISLQDAAEQLRYLELSGESLRREMIFQFPLEQVTEVIVLSERLSIVQIDKIGTVAKNVWSLGFSGSYEKVFIVIVSVLSILFFFRPKSLAKADKEWCLIENPKNFFNPDCKPAFKKLCPVHKFCVWDFVDSIPKCA